MTHYSSENESGENDSGDKRVADYIREARSRYGLTQRTAAKLLDGYAVAPIEAGVYLPSNAAAKRLAKKLNLPPTFFSALARERDHSAGKKRREGAAGRDLPLVGILSESDGALSVDSTGQPLEPTQHTEAWTEGPADPRAFAVQMGDASMAPIFSAGDILVVSGARPYLPGDAVLVGLQDGRWLCRLVSFTEEDLLLRSPAGEAFTVRAQRDTVKVVLKVVMRLIR